MEDEKWLLKRRGSLTVLSMLLCAALLGACGKEEEAQCAVPEWEDAYKEIVRNMESCLADPYVLRQEPDWADSDFCIGYIGTHDFDGDGVPELMIGDDVSMGIFTCEDGMAKKIADLYEPEDWSYIGGVYYRENTIILVNSGSDGSCYVCFSCCDGEYVTGVYDEYKPQTAVLNGKEVTEEEFKERFDLAGLSRDSFIPRGRIKKEDGIVTAFVIDAFRKEDEYILVEDLDFGAIGW